MNTSTQYSTLTETDANVIRAELDRLLKERRFSGARQMSAFLRYIVCQTLEGNGARIKAYTVGVDALGKPGDFDAQADPSVRVLALRLRRSLAAVYEENPDCFARIVLKVGSYVPEFHKPLACSSSEDSGMERSLVHSAVAESAVSATQASLQNREAETRTAEVAGHESILGRREPEKTSDSSMTHESTGRQLFEAKYGNRWINSSSNKTVESKSVAQRGLDNQLNKAV